MPLIIFIMFPWTLPSVPTKPHVILKVTVSHWSIKQDSVFLARFSEFHFSGISQLFQPAFPFINISPFTNREGWTLMIFSPCSLTNTCPESPLIPFFCNSKTFSLCWPSPHLHLPTLPTAGNLQALLQIFPEHCPKPGLHPKLSETRRKGPSK